MFSPELILALVKSPHLFVMQVEMDLYSLLKQVGCSHFLRSSWGEGKLTVAVYFKVWCFSHPPWAGNWDLQE